MGNGSVVGKFKWCFSPFRLLRVAVQKIDRQADRRMLSWPRCPKIPSLAGVFHHPSILPPSPPPPPSITVNTTATHHWISVPYIAKTPRAVSKCTYTAVYVHMRFEAFKINDVKVRHR